MYRRMASSCNLKLEICQPYSKPYEHHVVCMPMLLLSQLAKDFLSLVWSENKHERPTSLNYSNLFKWMWYITCKLYIQYVHCTRLHNTLYAVFVPYNVISVLTVCVYCMYKCIHYTTMWRAYNALHHDVGDPEELGASFTYAYMYAYHAQHWLTELVQTVCEQVSIACVMTYPPFIVCLMCLLLHTDPWLGTNGLIPIKRSKEYSQDLCEWKHPPLTALPHQQTVVLFDSLQPIPKFIWQSSCGSAFSQKIV